ncbi:MAG: hypothetical protein WDN06_11225 [Asticcacaulis sp.]
MVLSKITLRHQLYGVAGLFLVPVVLLSCAAAGTAAGSCSISAGRSRCWRW